MSVHNTQAKSIGGDFALRIKPTDLQTAQSTSIGGQWPLPIRPHDPPRVSKGSQIVKVIVGPEGPATSQQQYTLHKDLVCAASKFFRMALTGPFLEAQNKEIKFPEEDPLIFRAFGDWLYGTYPGTQGLSKKVDWQMYWYNVFCLGDRLFCPGLQLFAVRQIQTILNPDTPVKPSPDLVLALSFNEFPMSALIIRGHVWGHLRYWLQNSSEENEAWAAYSTPFIDDAPPGGWEDESAAARYVSFRVLTESGPLGSWARDEALPLRARHPCNRPGLAKQLRLDLAELEKEARAFDQ